MRRWDWVFLIPLLVACLVAFFRFPLLQNDDHLKVIRFIAREVRWPPVIAGDPANQAQHILTHHTLAAGLYRGMELLGGHAPLKPERAAQLLSLLWALGIIPAVWLLCRRMVDNNEARIMAFLVFGTFTYWVISSVTIDNDMAMSFWGNWALLVAVGIMQSRLTPRWRSVLLLGLLIGLSSLMKATGLVMFVIAAGSLLARRWVYREAWKPVLLRVLLVIAVWSVLASPNYLRNYRDTGRLVCHRDIRTSPGTYYPDERWDYFSFRFPAILRRPFAVNTGDEIGDERANEADYSFWSKLYVTWWRLPDYLVEVEYPNPWATSLLYLVALLIPICGLIGIGGALLRIRTNPAWLPVVGWLLVGIAGMLAGTWYLPTIICGSFNHARFISFATGSQVVLVAYGFQLVIQHWPRLRGLLWALISMQLVAFWWLLLSGPFYAFWETWPKLISP